MSIGDLLVQGMQQTPAARLNQPLQGPNPAPGGASPAPGGASPAPASSALPPAQAYGPDPSTAASIQALMQMHAQDRAANSIDRGLAGMAASFGPLETRNAIMNSAQPQDDRLRAMSQATLLQNAETEQTEHARAMGGAEAFGAGAGWKPGQATELGNLGVLGAAAGATVTPSPDMKNANEAADAFAKANPNATPQEVAAYKAKILTNIVDPAARAANIEIAKSVAEAKDPAAFNKADTQLAAVQSNLDWFLAHPRETQEAVRDADWRLGAGNEGWIGRYSPLGASSGSMEAKARLDQLTRQLSAESLTNSGMSRMAQSEFWALGNSMSTLGNKQLPADAVTKEVERLKEQALRLGANVKAQGGVQLDPTYSGYADPRYFDKSNPYYTGATTTKDAPAPGTKGTGATPGAGPADLSKLSGNEIGKAYDALPAGSTYVAPDGKTRTKQ